MKILFSLVIVLLFLVQFHVYFLLPVVRMYNLLTTKKPNKNINANAKILSTKTVLNNVKRTSFLKKVKNNIRLYGTGLNRYVMFKVGLIPSHTLRKFIYRKCFLVKLDRTSIIYFGAELRSGHKLYIGKGSIIGDKSILDARNTIVIGKNVNFSSNVHIWTEQHDYNDPYFACNSDDSFRVIIEDRVWIGPNTTIMKGVKIGEGAVVAAGAVVTKNVKPFTLVAGIPAKEIGVRNKYLKYKFVGSHLPFY